MVAVIRKQLEGITCTTERLTVATEVGDHSWLGSIMLKSLQLRDDWNA